MKILGDGAGDAGKGGNAPGGSGNSGGNSGGDQNQGDKSEGNSGGNSGGSGGEKPWYDGLPDNLKANTALTQFKDLPSFAKSWEHAQTLVGKKGVFVPGDKAPDEEWSAFYKSIGQPELDKFEVKTPEGVKVKEELVKGFKETAHKMGLLPKQAQGFLDWYLKFEKDSVDAAMNNFKADAKAGMDALKKEWADGFDRHLSIGEQALSHEGMPKGTVEWLQKRGLNKDPMMIKVLNAYGKLLGEDKLRGDGGDGKMGGHTPAEMQKAIADIQAQPAYWDRNHPGHKRAVDEVSGYYQKMSGG